MRIFAGLQELAQDDDGPLVIRNFDTDGRFAGNAIDTNGFRFERQAEVVAETGDLGVLDAGFRFELEGRYDRTGVDVVHRAFDFELEGFLLDQASALPKRSFVDLNGT